MLQPTDHDYDNILRDIVLASTIKVHAESIYKKHIHLNRFFVKLILDILMEYKLIKDESNHNYEMYSVTPLGYNVVKTSNFTEFKKDEEIKLSSLARRNELELKQLEQSVIINKYQYWFMIIGAVGGVISFIYVTCQFIIQLTSL